MKLEKAQSVAKLLLCEISPWCSVSEIAGSIRREVAEVKDIEIVCIPEWAPMQRPGCLFPETDLVNQLFHYLHASEFIQWIKPGTPEIIPWPIKPEGKYWRGLIKQGRFDAPNDIKLDLFIARPDNWGVIKTIRTGSGDFSRELVTYARDKTPYRVEGGFLTRSMKMIPCPDEETLFAKLELRYIEPTKRRGAQDIIRL